ncbi:melanocortin receptor 5-like [Mercenaria mercenaria]|uniref:melanocortin receptor 5-like n=1 Tax=Mercenaria mercenaria TaxID=6596 RepID=UPI00234F42AC|nr:melanocortin receptor 5-like [Mercenaria mercenaria]
MLTLAFDILLLVKYPLQYEELMSQRRGNRLLIGIWSGSITFVLIFRLIVELDWFRVIDITWSSYPMKGYVHYVYGAFQALSNVCFLVFIIVYLAIYVEIRKFIARVPSGEAFGSVKAAVTMVIILIAYVVCMMPASWIVLAGVITGNASLFRKLVVISRSLYVANSVCDPLIYAIRIPEIRKRYKLVCCKKDRNETNTAMTTIAANTT